MQSLVLHKHNASPPSRAVMMLGNYLGLEFEFNEPNTLAGELHAPDYLEKNPMHTLPILEEGDFAIADSHAIIVYLVTKYGGQKRKALYPEDIYLAATIDSRLHFDTGILFPHLRAITEPTIRGNLSGVTAEQIEKVEDAYGMLEAYLNQTTYLACDQFTIADICAGATVTSLNSLVPIDCDRFPKVIDWIGNLHAENCFLEVNSPGLQEFSALIYQFWDVNRNKPNPYAYAMRR